MVKPSALQAGNRADREGRWEEAVRHYAEALLTHPQLADTLFGNLQRVLRQEAESRTSPTAWTPLRVVVAGYELGHNAAGRAATLVGLHARCDHHVELIGPVVAPYADIWHPLRQSEWSRRTPAIASFGDFLRVMVPLVAAGRADVVHLSKARGPNILTGALYKLLWNSTVVIDVDDEELGFVGAAEPLSLAAWQALPVEERALSALFGREWTRLAVGLINAFDGVTVANSALQSRYGGVLLPHARDERELSPDPARRQRQRARWGIEPSMRVVLFFGTPRAHKGLLEIARALAGLADPRWRLVVVGSFEDAALQRELESVGQGLVVHLPGQPMSAIADVVSMADVCVLLQQGRGQAVQLQTPAKLTDALAMRVPVLATETAGLQEFIHAGVVQTTSVATIAADLTRWFDAPSGSSERQALTERGRNFFEQKLSYAAHVATLTGVMREAARAARPHRDVLQWQPLQVLREALRTER